MMATAFLGYVLPYGQMSLWGLPLIAPDAYLIPLLNKFIFVMQECLKVGNMDLITQFQGRYYKQKRGLAMGVADSPDLANLYGWAFEKDSCLLTDDRCEFYGRYIDDIISIVYADSDVEAYNYVSSNVSFDGCVIEWSTGVKSTPFLDMTVSLRDSQIHFKPYKKDHNHMERVPWISHHPYDVKRGTFIGELSRLAGLSSEVVSYRESVQDLVDLYANRGYPVELVNAWSKKYMRERWLKRPHAPEALKAKTVESDDSNGVLVLKSHYNQAWNYFNAKELGEQMLGYWRSWYEHAERGSYNNEYPPWEGNLPESLGAQARYLTEVTSSTGSIEMIPDLRKILITEYRVLVSKKRTRNMLDLASLWKKLVLQKVEDNVITEPSKAPVKRIVKPPKKKVIAPWEREALRNIAADERRVDAQRRYMLNWRSNAGRSIHQRSSSEERDKPFFG